MQQRRQDETCRLFQHNNNNCHSDPSFCCVSQHSDSNGGTEPEGARGASTCSYLVQQQVEGAIAHVLCDYAEELGFVADAQDLDDVVESGFVEHLCLLQQTVPLSETQTGGKRSVSTVAHMRKPSVSHSSFCNLETRARERSAHREPSFTALTPSVIDNRTHGASSAVSAHLMCLCIFKV